MSIVLASASPRRRELLQQIGIFPRICPVDVDETPEIDEAPDQFALRMARLKAMVAGDHPGNAGLPVLAADTVVSIGGRILGKPQGRADAMDMLTRLSGRTHVVYSGVALRVEGRVHEALSTTRVTFRRIRADEIDAYWNTGEPADKAGAYGIQSIGALFVRRIHGSYSGVVGLPLFETARLLARCGIPTVLGSGGTN